MIKRLFLKRFLAATASTVMSVFLFLPNALCQNKGGGEGGIHNRQGMEYFKKGFYDHTPKHQDAEAEMNYGFAVKEFTAAIAQDPSSLEAHRNLARVYHVQKNFAGAAEEYKRVTELAPDDLDAYVNGALAFIELKRFDEAIQTLERAKGQTSDPKVLDTLDAYIVKVSAYQAKEVR